jgi:serine/threonine protein kinase
MKKAQESQIMAIVGKLLGGHFRVTGTLGGGGMGETYIAVDMHRPRQPICVVKRLKPLDSSLLPTARKLFKREAETLERLGHHDQIPRLLAYFEEDKEFFLVQEFIEGQPLSVELPAKHRWTEAKVIQLLEDVLTILEFVHAEGVIHRDIKPANLIRRHKDSRLVLIDFGAVKEVRYESSPSGHSRINQMLTSIGTEGYMPPEQQQGSPDLSSDIYALGMIGIQALTGISPTEFRRRDKDKEIIWQPNAQASEGLVFVLSNMVRYYFRDRYQSATEALQALQEDKLQDSIVPKFTHPENRSAIFSVNALEETKVAPPYDPSNVESPLEFEQQESGISPTYPSLAELSFPKIGLQAIENSPESSSSEWIAEIESKEPQINSGAINLDSKQNLPSTPLNFDAQLTKVARQASEVKETKVAQQASEHLAEGDAIPPAREIAEKVESPEKLGFEPLSPLEKSYLNLPETKVSGLREQVSSSLNLPETKVNTGVAIPETVPEFISAKPLWIEIKPWKMWSGLGVLGIIAIAGFAGVLHSPVSSLRETAAVQSPPLISPSEPDPSSTAVLLSLPDLPCQEPPLPALPSRSPDYKYPNGTQFYGAMVNGRPAAGRVMMIFPSGNRYAGELKNGRRNGCGTYTFKNGKRYIGQFKNDRFEGKGIWMLGNGDRYVGSFQDNHCQGEGIFLFADGSSKQGNWRNGDLVNSDLSCNR